jgi:hypothetical protein
VRLATGVVRRRSPTSGTALGLQGIILEPGRVRVGAGVGSDDPNLDLPFCPGGLDPLEGFPFVAVFAERRRDPAALALQAEICRRLWPWLPVRDTFAAANEFLKDGLIGDLAVVRRRAALEDQVVFGVLPDDQAACSASAR